MSIENTTDRAMELSRYHETLDIYILGPDGAPITLTGGDAAIIREPIRIGPHQSAAVEAQVQLEPCAGTSISLAPGHYQAAVAFFLAEGGPTMYASAPHPVTVIE